MKNLMLFAVLLVLMARPAYAIEYSTTAPDTQLFGAPTSIEPVTVVGMEDGGNIDRGKNTALAPPAFGSAASGLSGSGEPLLYNAGESPATYTQPTDNPFYSGDYIGTLHIPSINLSVPIYEGTDNEALAKGAGHFPQTSAWDGNVALAGHNRGVVNHFGQIHTLQTGDIIRLTTTQGTRTYAVRSVWRVDEYDTSGLAETSANVLTLYTCVMNQPSLRWYVRAVEV